MRSGNFLYDCLNDFFQKRGLSLTHVTPKNLFLDFNAKLNPMNNNVKLLSFGGRGDGSYVVPDDLVEISALISPGVGDTVSFELDLWKQAGIPAFLVDATVNKPLSVPDSFVFLSKLVAPSSDPLEQKVEIRELIELADQSFGRGDLILSMDIEGGETDIFKYLDRESLNRFRIIICEFHYLDLWADNDYFNTYIIPIFDKILKDFSVVHFEENSHCGGPRIHGHQLPSAIELTFLRKDRLKRFSSEKRKVSVVGSGFEPLKA